MRGIVIGKFYPPHLGHNYLIDTALKNSDKVDVLVVDNPSYAISSIQRAKWLRDRHPKANIQIIPDINDDDNSSAWAQHTIQFLGYTPDIVFSSEPYGQTWAEAMGCKYVDVDIGRNKVPISGTLVRQDFIKYWRYLSSHTKAAMAIRIVVVGAESTGTTTLSMDLADKLKAPYVPEIGRYYTESLLTLPDSIKHNNYTEVKWNEADFHTIGHLQQNYENAIASRSNGIIICDTNATATELWQRRYIGQVTPEMKTIAARDIVNLYIITAEDIPFDQDGIRDGEHWRSRMNHWFIERIKKSGVPYIIVSGTRAERLSIAHKEIQHIIEKDRVIK